jgi:hypothetical protein
MQMIECFNVEVAEGSRSWLSTRLPAQPQNAPLHVHCTTALRLLLPREGLPHDVELQRCTAAVPMIPVLLAALRNLGDDLAVARDAVFLLRRTVW